MTHHAYLITGDTEQGIDTALTWVQKELKLETTGNPDVTVLRYGLFSVEEARTFQDAVMRTPIQGDTKAIIVSASRFFYQAQNALLKIFEETPKGTFLFLVLPTEGVVLPTLRSRLISLKGEEGRTNTFTTEFISAPKEGREKLVAKLLERTKSDKEEEKVQARKDASVFLEGLMRTAYSAHQKTPSPELTAFLSDLNRFAPLMHEAATPLKLIFEHILLTTPKALTIR